MDRKSSSIIDLKSTSIIDLLIEELLTLKNCKQQNFPLSPFKTKTKTPRTVQKSTHFERNSQKISIKDLEETPPKHISEDYSEDFDSMSLTPSQLKKSQNLKSAILTNYSQTNHEKTNQYTEEFESYTISETVNKLKLENKSLSDSNSQSNSQKKMVNCFICSAKIDASLAPEHAKICKISNLKYSQKKNGKFLIKFYFLVKNHIYLDKLGRNSINSIKEEVEKEKEIPISDKNSFRKGIAFYLFQRLRLFYFRIE